MSGLKLKKVTKTWFEISFDSTQRSLGRKIDDFLSESPDLEEDEWEDNHTVIRDFDGDFDGILIYNNDNTAPLIKFICEKVGADYESVKENIKLIS